MNELELSQRLDDVRAAENRLLGTLERLDEAALRAPSLLPGWTRGHVLAHVALNAHSLVNLFSWARTGVETPQYPSWDERDADIKRYATRTGADHRAALEEAAAAFEAAARAVPPGRWAYPVAGIGGDAVPAVRFLFGRLREVEIHHVDLDAGYGPHDWDDAFVRAVLEEAPDRLSPRAEVSFVARAADLGVRVAVGPGPAAAEVVGPGQDVLAWLLGRTDGSALDAGRTPLPPVPPWG